MNSDNNRWRVMGILALIGALVYLPLAGNMGLYNDDWYLMYDAHSQGAQFFHAIYAIDRPARAYVMQATYTLFGDNILYYHVSAYAYRTLAAWMLFWVLCLAAPKQSKVNFIASTLFLIYPGFLSQLNPIDYQSQILSLLLAIASIAFTVKAIQSTTTYSKILWSGFAIITGVAYPALVDYSIGLEALRLCMVVMTVLQEHDLSLREIVKKSIRLWAPFLSAPAIFLFWRLFLFENERRATDLGAQFGQVFSSPLTGLWWLINWMQDTLQVFFMAWVTPLNTLTAQLRLRDYLWGISIGLGVAVLTVIGYSIVRSAHTKDAETGAGGNWPRELLFIGIVSASLALLPVIVSNRQVDFENYSRYTLASAAGAGMVLAVLLESISPRQIKMALLGVLVFMASLTHYSNAVRAVIETETVRNFWWQVAWRVPDFEPGVTLVADYPASAIQEDYFVWGPANFIYYPEEQNTVPIEIRIPAAVLTREVVAQILAQKGSESPLRRGNQLTRDFGNVLVLSQAEPHTCVRILDGQLPELSVADEERIMLVAQNSKLENVLTQGQSPTPPVSIFGSEPVHDWCFYYQKASLARQRGEWEVVAELGDEAQRLGLHPNDPIEWMPFLQAYAVRGNKKQVKEISTRINTEQYYRHEACNALNFIKVFNPMVSLEMQEYMDGLFCK